MGVTTRLLLLATITGVKSYLLNHSHAKVAFSCMVLWHSAPRHFFIFITQDTRPRFFINIAACGVAAVYTCVQYMHQSRETAAKQVTAYHNALSIVVEIVLTRIDCVAEHVIEVRTRSVLREGRETFFVSRLQFLALLLGVVHGWWCAVRVLVASAL